MSNIFFFSKEMMVYVKRIGKDMRIVLTGVADSTLLLPNGLLSQRTDFRRENLNHTPAPHLRMQVCFSF